MGGLFDIFYNCEVELQRFIPDSGDDFSDGDYEDIELIKVYKATKTIYSRDLNSTSVSVVTFYQTSEPIKEKDLVEGKAVVSVVPYHDICGHLHCLEFYTE